MTGQIEEAEIPRSGTQIVQKDPTFTVRTTEVAQVQHWQNLTHLHPMPEAKHWAAIAPVPDAQADFLRSADLT